MKGNQVIERIRKLNRIFLMPKSEDDNFHDEIKAIAEVTKSAVLLLDKEGGILSSHTGEVDTGSQLGSFIESGSLTGEPVLASKIKNAEPQVNEPYVEEGSSQKVLFTMLPIRSGSARLGSLLFLHPERELDKDHLILAEVGAALIGMHVKHKTSDQEEKETRNKELAEGAFESLSFSEVEAIREILKNISNNESVVVASKIADSLGITRSVIVNALRKFESAGIIESRSLGMKGTLIKVKNTHALEIVASQSDKMSHIR